MACGIIGNGFVGQATQYILEGKGFIYDVCPEKCEPVGLTLQRLCEECDIVFICVPTPMLPNGDCYTDIVETCINQLHEHKFQGNIVVRSTVPVGFCEQHKVSFFPEFLTERNWKEDCKNCSNWILGVGTPSVHDRVRRILEEAKRNGVIVSSNLLTSPCSEVEMVKLTRNAFLAVKVSFFNEMESFCRVKGLKYDSIINLVTKDERIGKSHTQVPGPDGKRGYGGTCFPKDIASLARQFAQNDVKFPLMKASIARNKIIDRPERDWKENRGRAVV